MTSAIVKLRTLVRAGLSLALIIALSSMMFLLLTELNDPNPNAALTALLGSITGALGTALVTLVGAIAGTMEEERE